MSAKKVLGRGLSAIIEDVEESGFELSEEINRFEAGTPNVANIFAFAKVLEFLTQHNWPLLQIKTHNLNQYFYKELSNLDLQKYRTYIKEDSV